MDDFSNRISIQELVKQIWNIEHIKVELTVKPGYPENALVKPYNYDPLPDDAMLDDLYTRIDECMSMPRYLINL